MKLQQNAKTDSLRRRLGTKKDLIIGTWNIRTLYRGGALKNLIGVFVDYSLDVLAIQEIRWLGTEILDKKDYRLYYSCQEKTLLDKKDYRLYYSCQKKTLLDKKDYRLYYSCQEKTHHFGVGFIVSKRLRNAVIDFQRLLI